MIIKLKEGDSYIEVDTEFSDDMVDTLDNDSDAQNDLDDTIDLEKIMEKDNEAGEN